jgi:hypothetical protein
MILQTEKGRDRKEIMGKGTRQGASTKQSCLACGIRPGICLVTLSVSG